MIILVIIGIILYTIVISYFIFKELFDSPKPTVLTSQRLNFNDNLNAYNILSIPLSGWEYVLYKLSSKEPLRLYGNPEKLIINPLDYQLTPDYVKDESIVLPKGYFFVFTSRTKKEDFGCGFDFTGKKIGYFDITELKLIDSILYGYRTTGKLIPLLLTDIWIYGLMVLFLRIK